MLTHNVGPPLNLESVKTAKRHFFILTLDGVLQVGLSVIVYAAVNRIVGHECRNYYI